MCEVKENDTIFMAVNFDYCYGVVTLTILQTEVIIYCLFEKKKLRHSLGRPSRSDLVQPEVNAARAAGVDIKSVQDCLGHKESKTLLDIYAKIKSTAAKEKTSEVMSGILRSFEIEE